MATDLKIVSIQSGAKKSANVETGPFGVGVQVYLKSGGPVMTVQKPGKEWTETTWFNDIGERVGPEEFLNDTIALYEPPKPKRRTYRGNAK